MKIDKYIADLLFVYDCVVIPGFGGLIGNYAPARITNSTHTFTPPFKQLAFNINLKNNDGLLAEYISRNENITFNQANAIIQNYADALHMELKSKKTYEVEEVGTFLLDTNENIRFEQNQDVNFLLDSFGLTSFHSPAIKRDRTKKKSDTVFVDRPPITPESPRVKLKKSWAVYFAVPLGLFMAFSLYNNQVKKNVSQTYSSINPFTVAQSDYAPRVISVASKDKNIADNELETEWVLPVKSELPSVEMNEAVAKEESTVSVSNLNLALDTKISSVNQLNMRFHIISGCFGSPENAMKMVSDLKTKGYDSYVLDIKNGLSRVSCGAFENKDEAMQALEKVKSLENAGAWLFAK